MILTHKTSLPSCKILRDVIKEKTGRHLLITTDPEKLRGKKLHLRYGNSSPVPCGDTEYNSPQFIKLCADKSMFSSVVLKSGLGIETPAFVKLRDKLPDYFPVIIRSTLTGSKGQGIENVVNGIEELNKCSINHYWAQYYKISKEYRAHVIEGKVVKLFVKVLREGEEEQEFPIRTNEHYQFKLVDYENGVKEGKYKELTDAVLQCQNVINGKFYALDLGYVPEISKYVIIEGNSGPGLNELTAEIYADYLVGRIF